MEPIYRISIVTIVLNQKEEIADTIESVLSQESIELEYIVIDGGSTDGTLDVIEKYRHRIQHFRSGPDGGIYHAINKGVAIATAPIVGLIHCGDLLKPGSLAAVCSAFYHNDPDVVYGDIEISEQLGQKCIRKLYKADHRLLKRKMTIFHPSTFVKKNIYEIIGGYDTQYRSAADYDFFLNLFMEGYHFLHVPYIMAIFTAGGFSEKNYKLSKSENYRIRVNRIGKLHAIFYWIESTLSHAFFSYRKKILTGLMGTGNFNRLKLFLKR